MPVSEGTAYSLTADSNDIVLITPQKRESEIETAFYLLTLFKFQLDPGLDAIAGVLIGLLQSELHEVLVVRARQVPADEDDHVGQDLKTERAAQEGECV